MAVGYLIACESGSPPIPVTAGLNGTYLQCARISGAIDPMVIIEHTQTSQADQLASLTTFDPVLAAGNIGFCMLIFTLGFSAGIVIRNMRRL